MKRTSCLGCWVSVVASLVGCAGARQAPPPREAAVEPVSGPAYVAPGEPDLSPVAAPGEVIVVGRLQSPVQSVDLLASWTGLPLNWRTLMDGALPQTSLGPGREVLALDAPVDLLVTLPRAGSAPEPRMAFSVGVASLEGALELAEALDEDIEAVGTRLYRIGGRNDLTCMLGPAAGRAPARLVCGDGFGDVEELMPYMTRTLPRETVGAADLHVELRVEPIRRVYGPTLAQAGQLGIPFLVRELSLDDPRLDRAVAEAARGLLAEGIALIDDVDRLSLTVDLDGPAGAARAAMAADFRGTKSWTGTTLLDAMPRATSAPDAFWNLPADVPAASFSAPSNPERWREVRRSAGEILDALMVVGKVPDPLRKQVTKLVEQTLTRSLAAVVVQGPNPAPSQRAGADSDSDDPEIRILPTLIQQLGWQISQIEAPAKEYTDYFDGFVRVYNDRATTKLLEERIPGLGPAAIPRLAAKPAGAGFPAGSRRYELTVTSSTDGAPVTVTQLHLVVVPDGERTWIAFGDNLDLLRKETARLRAPAAKTLRDRPGLEALRSGRFNGAGFTTLRVAFKGALQQYVKLSDAEVERVMNLLPARGETPMITTIRVTDEGAARLEWATVVPKAVVQDFAAAVPAVMASSLLSGSLDTPP